MFTQNTVTDCNSTATMSRNFLIMCDHQYGHARRLQLFQKSEYRARIDAVEIPGGLIAEQERWPSNQSPGDGDPLSLAARQPRRRRVNSVTKPDFHQCFVSSSSTFFAWYPTVDHGQGDIFQRAPVGEEMEGLEDKTNALTAQ